MAPHQTPDTIGLNKLCMLKDLKRMDFFWELQSRGIWLFANCELTSYLQIVIEFLTNWITRLKKVPAFSSPSKPPQRWFCCICTCYNLSSCSVNSCSKNLIQKPRRKILPFSRSGLHIRGWGTLWHEQTTNPPRNRQRPSESVLKTSAYGCNPSQ